MIPAAATPAAMSGSQSGAEAWGLPLFVQFAERASRAYEASAPQEGARAGQAGTMFALWRKRLSGSQVRLISRSLANRSGPKAAATRAAV